MDEIVLTLVRSRWQKVAMVVAKAQKQCEKRKIAANADEIATRIAWLAHGEQIDSKGKLSNWRHSEVRLPA